jgi:hypothetical protein
LNPDKIESLLVNAKLSTRALSFVSIPSNSRHYSHDHEELIRIQDELVEKVTS